MAFKFSYEVEVRTGTDKEKLTHEVESWLSKLSDLGLIVKETEQGVEKPRVRIYELTPGYSDPGQVGTVREPLSADGVSELVKLYDQTIFKQGLRKLEDRIAGLGWWCYIDGDQIAHVRTARNTSMQYRQLNQQALNYLQDEVLHAELRRKLADQQKDFTEAGIAVEVEASSFTFVLQENDPALKRSLTEANVDKLIALAHAWNERF